MKRRLILFLAMAQVAMLPSWGRLGETERAIVNRYGPCSLKTHRPWGDEEFFQINGFSITVTFIDGVSVGEFYRLPVGQHITDEMQVSLLDANSQGYPWSDVPPSEWPKMPYPQIKGMWRRPNESTAIQTDNSFEVKSIYLIIAQENAAKHHPAAPTTQGF